MTFGAVRTVDPRRLLRAVELYEVHRVDYAEAYLAAVAENGDSRVASFDRGLDRVPSIVRVEP